jgi:hypothetical protein
MKTVYFRAELIFPHESVPALADVGNGQWEDLVARVADLPETHEDSLAYSLMMIRLCGIQESGATSLAEDYENAPGRKKITEKPPGFLREDVVAGGKKKAKMKVRSGNVVENKGMVFHGPERNGNVTDDR